MCTLCVALTDAIQMTIRRSPFGSRSGLSVISSEQPQLAAAQFTGRVPHSLRAYSLLIWACAIAVVLTATRLPSPSISPADGFWIPCSLALLIAISGALSISFIPDLRVHAGHAPLFVAILLFPVFIAGAVGAVGIIAYHRYFKFQSRSSWFATQFSTGSVIFEVALAGLVYQLLTTRLGGSGFAALALPPLAAGLIVYTANVVASFGEAGLRLERNPLRLWSNTAWLDISQAVVMLSAGYAATLVVRSHPLFAAALLLSLGASYCSLRLSVRVRNGALAAPYTTHND